MLHNLNRRRARDRANATRFSSYTKVRNGESAPPHIKNKYGWRTGGIGDEKMEEFRGAHEAHMARMQVSPPTHN